MMKMMKPSLSSLLLQQQQGPTIDCKELSPSSDLIPMVTTWSSSCLNQSHLLEEWTVKPKKALETYFFLFPRQYGPTLQRPGPLT